MLELFCRAPEGLTLAQGSHLTPIPIDEVVESLSAILLDEDYYYFILTGRRDLDGLPWVGEDRLIPLKASAWLDLSQRLARGDQVDSRNVRKHANDILRLSQLLAPEVRVPLVPRIAQDLSRFLDAIEADPLITPASVGVRSSLKDVVGRIAFTYSLDRGTQP